VVDASGENAIIQAPQANRALTADDVRRVEEVFARAGVALAQLETSMPALREFCTLARATGAKVILNPAPAAHVTEDVLAAAHVIVANEIEAATLLHDAAAGDAWRNAEQLSVQIDRDIIVTRGARGAVAQSSGARIEVPAFAVDVIDTVGAGDAFCAGLAVRLAEGASLADAMRFASAAGALACAKPGAEPSMPQRADVEALLATGVPVS
jgi:ribokinase